MSRSRARLAADWFAKLRQNAVTNAVEHIDVTDVSADVTTVSDSAVRPNDSPTFAGLTTTGDVVLGDNDKAIFGAGSDLQIYHDGSNSFISDTGTGDLFIEASNNHYLRFINGEYAITTTENAQVALRYDNVEKLATTSTGIDVTGSVTVSGNVGIGTSSPSALLHVSGTGIPTIKIEDTDAAGGYAHFEVNGAALFIEAYDDDGTAGQTVFKNGSTESMRLSESGRLGIGTTAPDQALHVQDPGTSAAGTIKMGADYHGYVQQLSNNLNIISNGDQAHRVALGTNNGTGNIVFQTAHGTTGNTERMRLNSTGDLHVDGNVIAYSTTISDERLKTDIVKIDGALDKVDQINGYTFTYTADGKKSAGVIAQEVQKVLPSAITESKLPLKMGDDDETEYMTVQYDQLIGLLVEAVKELKAEVAELKGK